MSQSAVNLSAHHALVMTGTKGEGTNEDPARFVHSVWNPSTLELFGVIDAWEQEQYATMAEKIRDLLDALYRMARSTGSDREDRAIVQCYCDKFPADHNHDFKCLKAKAAIAKATGEQP